MYISSGLENQQSRMRARSNRFDRRARRNIHVVGPRRVISTPGYNLTISTPGRARQRPHVKRLIAPAPVVARFTFRGRNERAGPRRDGLLTIIASQCE